MDGLRSFIEADNHSAVDVGHLRKGITPLCVKKPNFSEDDPEVAIREGADDMTPIAEELDTLKACINIDLIEDDRWEPPLVDADWHAFCQAIYKGIEGKEWEELYCHYRGAAGANEPSDSQKAKDLWAMKAVKDRREEYCDPARNANILGRKKTRLEL